MPAQPTTHHANLLPSPPASRASAFRRASRLRCFSVLIGWAVVAQNGAEAGIYTIPDITHAASTTEHFNFDSAWAGSPAINNMSGETSVYLKFTASWPSSAAPGDFDIRFAVDDNGGRGRAQVDFNDGSVQVYTENANNSDPDGAGPATARPVFSVNPLAMTTATFVLKVNQTLAGPGGDWSFGTIGQQSAANAFIYVNPNLATAEANNSTVIAGWRSGQNGYQSVTFETRNLAAGGMTFTNIALYTGDDTPFSAIAAVADAGTSTVSASPSAVPADGTTASTVTVTLRDAGNNPVSGKEVSLSGDGGAVIATGNNISNASGVVSFTVKSSVEGTETFTATVVTDGDLAITQTASVEFQEVVPVGPVDAANSTVAASPASVLANGISTATITVTLRDGNGQLVTGEDVTLGGSPANANIGPAVTQPTDGNGRAVFSVSSSVVGNVVFTATSSTDGVTVTQTAGVDFTDPQDAQAFNVNFLDEGQAALAGQVGLVGSPGETWNQGTTSVNNLVDTSGTVTSAVSVSGLGNDGRIIPGAALSVFGGVRNFTGKGLDTTISITGLEANTAYDLYIYALSHNVGSWGNSTDTERAAGDFVTTNPVLGNGQSQFLDNGVAGTGDARFVPNGNYVAFESIVSDASGNITVIADAYDGIDGLPATNDGNCRLHVNALQIRPASGMSVDYMKWRAAYHPGLGLPGEDDDGDGFTNDYERIFGMNPVDPSSVNPYPSVIDPDTGRFSYTRRAVSLVNMDYKVWVSTDLEEWSVDNAAHQVVESAQDEVETVAVGIDPALLAEPRLFMQVRVAPVTGIDIEPELMNLWGSGNTITLLFSEPMNPSSAGNPANYTVNQDGAGAIGVTGATLGAGGGSVTLTLASTLGTDTGYTVGLERVTSGTGQSLGTGISRPFRTWDNDPGGIKVFILAGQSNMVGFGNVETGAGGAGTIGSLRHLAVNDASFPDYNYASLLENPAQPADSPFRTRPDVKVWYRDGGNGNLGGSILKGDLGPPYKGRDAGRIGPEFAFGQVIGDHFASNDVLIIKCAWGGRDLAEKFRPPGAVAKRGGRVGDFFNATIDYSRQVLYNLDTEFPEWAGRGYEIVGFGWHQGYNDRISDTFSAEYKDNLPDFIADVRKVFDKPDMPFVIASTGMATGAAEAPPYNGYSAVEKAQLWVAGVAQPANVLSTDTRPFWREGAVSPAEQGFHWNHNAETYFLIGKALGDNMVDLLAP